MEAMMDAVGGCMMSDDHTTSMRMNRDDQNVDVNPHLITYWNSCRCVADRDMRIYYDVIKP
ncbi:hypothetical protein T4B_7337 [Trichinella pseudospiralis]|uniref:Uncharacterized protein n=1 Tax=Trichinella pseudospiralis TaxID=6337 RepID=A0A0V1GQ55_TRIPS|nr:hypothetical protein T4B_7337 [Trichinella pseudospiralis]KRZ01043.1 hypothetical protein T4C_11475 [Trichinella pseudospiralis]KRZ11023.1 hypothetical protein T4C_5490 [Trichinella pseudospiralis]KRZ12200.1 hypothetical protein T4C_12510 [Trichinella pseudospiralis]